VRMRERESERDRERAKERERERNARDMSSVGETHQGHTTNVSEHTISKRT